MGRCSMFDPGEKPRLFGIEPGVDFPVALARGLRARLDGQPPEAIARVEVIVNTARMQSRLREALIATGEGFLPRIRLIADLAPDTAAVPALRVRLELAQAIRALLRRQPDFGPMSSAFALADSLHGLLDEIEGEGVALSALESLDVSNHSEHWTRSLTFIRLIASHLGPQGGGQGRLRRAVMTLTDAWRAAPPENPVILAGSTGSRGPGFLLMQAVALLPQGAVVVPGFDRDMPERLWHDLDDPLTYEDHPQFRFARLMDRLGLEAGDVQPWTPDRAPDVARNALVSLSLRPAPVTDQWLHEGAGLGDLTVATAGLSLIEAATPRQEAMAIALCLRDAVVQGKKAALVTPDRTLARRVTAALDRWQIRPDDSAGRPLSLSAPGRFLRHCADILAGNDNAEALVALLKHPLAHGAGARGNHLRHLRDLELFLRKQGLPHLTAEGLDRWTALAEDRAGWSDWLKTALTWVKADAHAPLTEWVGAHVALTEHLAGAPGTTGTGGLWAEAAGERARAVIDDLNAQAAHGGDLTGIDYLALLETVFAGEEVRETVESDPRVMIWGTLEVRAQSADLVVLGGLNEGTWPAAPKPDAWFNRQMRLDAGLLLPERQIGLSAHDYQQAIAAPEAVLTRSIRDADAETVPARWVNRLLNLTSGLHAQGGQVALAQMRARGQHWLALADAFEADLSQVGREAHARNPRPAPAPPVAARPTELSVTRIETLIRDPFDIYAEHVLSLRELNPLAPRAEPRLRGTVLHGVLEDYVARFPPGTPGDTAQFMAIAEARLNRDIPWQGVRLHWLARLQRVAGRFVEWNAGLTDTPVLTEEKGRLVLVDPPFVLTGKPDRIDRTPDGALRIYDYKTGTPPTPAQQKKFAKQLILLAMMAEDGAFPGLDPAPVESAAFIGMGAAFTEVKAPVTPEDLAANRVELAELLRAYRQPNQGFTAMRALEAEADIRTYHPLARRGEWQPTDPAETVIVGDHDG